ncbi:MAG: N-acetylmuramoyl-L-alanine amidase [Oscillospiraceae bacterium]
MKRKRGITVILGVMIICLTVAKFCMNIVQENVRASTVGKMRMTVVLDAGHGGMDSGCVGAAGTLEKDVNLSVTMMLKDMLELNGFDVVLTRDSDRSIHDKGVKGIRNQKESDMDNRLEIINKSGADALVMIHQNKFTDPQYHGAQMFYSEDTEKADVFADIMQHKFVEYLQPDNDREIKECEDKIFLLERSEMPGVLIECGFLSNPEEEAKLKTEDYQKDIAFTIFSGIVEFLET